jgi:hypothetical protein
MKGAESFDGILIWLCMLDIILTNLLISLEYLVHSWLHIFTIIAVIHTFEVNKK